METRFEVYNRLFRFDGNTLRAPLRVVAFESTEAFDRHVSAQLGRRREGAVYLHYQRPERRELVIHRGAQDGARLEAHQAFIQFLRAFLPNPPGWIRDGFAVYFSTLGFNDETGSLEYEENLAWLDTVKSWGREGPALESVLLADIQGSFDNFVPASWALVSFLLNSGNIEYQRTLFESFMLLREELSAAENSRVIQERLNAWTNSAAFAQDYTRYFESRLTFAGLVDLGRASYQAGETVMAEMYFLQALELKSNHYAPYYYLGILAYEQKNWDLAEYYYRSALECGADRGLTTYALGLNALSAGRPAEARALLIQAAAIDPERYRAKVAELLSGTGL
jgi:tetratricopeptide (TPR) repeat protein